MRTEIDAQNRVTVERDGGGKWTCNNPGQAEKMLPTWSEMPPGDVSKIRDCAADYKRQIQTKRSYTPSARFVYANGEVTRVETKTTEIVAPSDNPVTASLARRILEMVA